MRDTTDTADQAPALDEIPILLDLADPKTTARPRASRSTAPGWPTASASSAATTYGTD